ncbi:MAG: MFS transporter [Syntrophorhabdaceae bacterium]|nr:MFS transporter [Syntrophorhabdaceae bacterium]
MARFEEFRGRALLFLIFLLFIWFVSFSVRIVFSPILPIIEDEFMVNHAKASAIFTFLSAGYGISVILSGLFSGRVGYKKSIILSVALLGLLTFLIPVVHTFYLLYLFAFVLGLAHGLYLPSAIPLITEYYAEKNWGKAIAIHDTGASSAIFATPLVAILLLQFFPWRGIFVVYGCVFVACLAVFCLVSTEVKIHNPARAIFREIIRIRSLWFMTAIWIFGAGANLGIYSITPLYLTKELGLSIDYANTILSVSRLVSIGVAVACGFIVDRFSLRKIMFFMMVIAGVFTVLLGLSPVRYTGVLLFFQAFFVTGFFPVGLVAIARTFGREMRGPATGIILSSAFFIGGGVMPWLLGISGDLYSFRLGITALGAFTMLASTFVFRLKELK